MAVPLGPAAGAGAWVSAFWDWGVREGASVGVKDVVGRERMKGTVAVKGMAVVLSLVMRLVALLVLAMTLLLLLPVRLGGADDPTKPAVADELVDDDMAMMSKIKKENERVGFFFFLCLWEENERHKKNSQKSEVRA